MVENPNNFESNQEPEQLLCEASSAHMLNKDNDEGKLPQRSFSVFNDPKDSEEANMQIFGSDQKGFSPFSMAFNQPNMPQNSNEFQYRQQFQQPGYGFKPSGPTMNQN